MGDCYLPFDGPPAQPCQGTVKDLADTNPAPNDPARAAYERYVTHCDRLLDIAGKDIIDSYTAAFKKLEAIEDKLASIMGGGAGAAGAAGAGAATASPQLQKAKEKFLAAARALQPYVDKAFAPPATSFHLRIWRETSPINTFCKKEEDYKEVINAARAFDDLRFGDAWGGFLMRNLYYFKRGVEQKEDLVACKTVGIESAEVLGEIEQTGHPPSPMTMDMTLFASREEVRPRIARYMREFCNKLPKTPEDMITAARAASKSRELQLWWPAVHDGVEELRMGKGGSPYAVVLGVPTWEKMISMLPRAVERVAKHTPTAKAILDEFPGIVAAGDPVDTVEAFAAIYRSYKHLTVPSDCEDVVGYRTFVSLNLQRVPTPRLFGLEIIYKYLRKANEANVQFVVIPLSVYKHAVALVLDMNEFTAVCFDPNGIHQGAQLCYFFTKALQEESKLAKERVKARAAAASASPSVEAEEAKDQTILKATEELLAFNWTLDYGEYLRGPVVNPQQVFEGEARMDIGMCTWLTQLTMRVAIQMKMLKSPATVLQLMAIVALEDPKLFDRVIFAPYSACIDVASRLRKSLGV